jgi:hypothetical protein
MLGLGLRLGLDLGLAKEEGRNRMERDKGRATKMKVPSILTIFQIFSRTS